MTVRLGWFRVVSEFGQQMHRSRGQTQDKDHGAWKRTTYKACWDPAGPENSQHGREADQVVHTADSHLSMRRGNAMRGSESDMVTVAL